MDPSWLLHPTPIRARAGLWIKTNQGDSAVLDPLHLLFHHLPRCEDMKRTWNELGMNPLNPATTNLAINGFQHVPTFWCFKLGKKTAHFDFFTRILKTSLISSLIGIANVDTASHGIGNLPTSCWWLQRYGRAALQFGCLSSMTREPGLDINSMALLTWAV